VVAARDDILAEPIESQPQKYLEAFRRFAAQDVVEMEPPAAADGAPRVLFPAGDDCVVVLANVPGIRVEGSGEELVMTACGAVDNRVRPSHVATATIQELLCGPLFGGAAAAPAPATPAAPAGPATPAAPAGSAPAAEADAGGPRVDPASVKVSGKKVTFTVTAPLHRPTVVRNAFSVSTVDARAWNNRSVEKATLASNGISVTLDLGEEPEGEAVRVIAHGTGPYPILGKNLLPLAGAAGGLPATAHDGRDFVFMIRKGS
jgi:hypothetical protein